MCCLQTELKLSQAAGAPVMHSTLFKKASSSDMP